MYLLGISYEIHWGFPSFFKRNVVLFFCALISIYIRRRIETFSWNPISLHRKTEGVENIRGRVSCRLVRGLQRRNAALLRGCNWLWPRENRCLRLYWNKKDVLELEESKPVTDLPLLHHVYQQCWPLHTSLLHISKLSTRGLKESQISYDDPPYLPFPSGCVLLLLLWMLIDIRRVHGWSLP